MWAQFYRKENRGSERWSSLLTEWRCYVPMSGLKLGPGSFQILWSPLYKSHTHKRSITLSSCKKWALMFNTDWLALNESQLRIWSRVWVPWINNENNHKGRSGHTTDTEVEMQASLSQELLWEKISKQGSDASWWAQCVLQVVDSNAEKSILIRSP